MSTHMDAGTLLDAGILAGPDALAPLPLSRPGCSRVRTC